MKKIRKFMMVLATLVLMFGLTNIGVSKVQAANPFIQKNVSYYLYENRNMPNGIISVYDPVPNGKISNIKNSNPDVVKVKLDKFDFINRWVLIIICWKVW